MLALILIRHAKSDWADPATEDHDRPLNARGKRDAPRIGAWLAAERHLPEAALCSSALRTRETWAGLAAQFPAPPEPRIMRDLYLAAPETMLNAIRGAGGRSLAVIGHNPGIGSLAGTLCEAPPDHPRFAVYPTCATLVLTFDGDDWSAIAPGMGKVADFIVPRDL